MLNTRSEKEVRFPNIIINKNQPVVGL